MFVSEKTIFAMTDLFIIKCIIAKNFQNVSDIIKKTLINSIKGETLQFMSNSKNTISIISNMGSIFVLDFNMTILNEINVK